MSDQVKDILNPICSCLMSYYLSYTIMHVLNFVGSRSPFCLQRFEDKWHVVQPDWREEHYRMDSRLPVMRFSEFTNNTLRPAFVASKDHPQWRQQYWRLGDTESEETRARGIHRVHWAQKNHNLYQFSNNMTGTQMKKPVTACYGPMLREKVYGVNTQHNRHGFMPATDYYF